MAGHQDDQGVCCLTIDMLRIVLAVEEGDVAATMILGNGKVQERIPEDLTVLGNNEPLLYS